MELLNRPNMKKLLLFLVVIMCFSCKEEKKSEEVSPITKEKPVSKKESETVVDNKFRIVIDGIFEKDDLILIYYTTEAEEKLNSDKFLTKKIEGKAQSQKVVFTFEEGQRPYNIRLDFSDNKEQGQVTLNTMILADRYNKVIINRHNLENHFSFSENMSFDKGNGILKGEVFKINDKDAYNPYILANQGFISVLNKLNRSSLQNKKVELVEDLYNLSLEDNKLRVVISGLFKSDDLVQLYYTMDSIENFHPELILEKRVKGSNRYQDLVFTLPEGEMLAKVRIDISDNKLQEKIIINKVSFLIDDSRLEIDKVDLGLYFIANNYIDFNTATGGFKCKIIKEEGLEKYNPYFVSSAKLVEELFNFL